MLPDEILKSILHKKETDKLKITKILLNNFFNAVQLSDGSVGAAMNYFKADNKNSYDSFRNFLMRKTLKDPLLLDYLFSSRTANLMKLSLQATVLSALSRDLFSEAEFNVEKSIPSSFFSDIDSATVIGFGGNMEFIVNFPGIKRVHISDLFYNHSNEAMNLKISGYRKMFPGKEITISDGRDSKEMIKKSMLVSITGSALCNGTMENLLEYSKNCRKIIVQGQSAAIYPKIFFEKGVSAITTTIKPTNLIETANSNFDEFRRLLEGGLPKIHILPKTI